MINFRRFFRRLFLQKVEFSNSMKPGEPVRIGYLLHYMAIPLGYESKTDYDLKPGKKIVSKIEKDKFDLSGLEYMAAIEPKDPDEISTGHFEHRNVIIPQRQMRIL